MLSLLFVKKFLFSKDGIFTILILGLLIGGYSWHRSVVRQAEQMARAEAKVEVMKEKDQEYQQFRKEYQETVLLLQEQIENLTKQRLNSQVIVKTIVEHQNEENKNIDNLNTAADLVNDIRARLSGAK